jgi:ATP synthase protein I
VDDLGSRRTDANPWRAAGFVSAIGLEIVICTAIGYVCGKYLGGSKGWVIACVMIGFFLGIGTAVMMLKKFLEDDRHE